MSIDVCEDCSGYIDTDYDTDCYINYISRSLVGVETKIDTVLCERCREDLLERLGIEWFED